MPALRGLVVTPSRLQLSLFLLNLLPSFGLMFLADGLGAQTVAAQQALVPRLLAYFLCGMAAMGMSFLIAHLFSHAISDRQKVHDAFMRASFGFSISGAAAGMALAGAGLALYFHNVSFLALAAMAPAIPRFFHHGAEAMKKGIQEATKL